MNLDLLHSHLLLGPSHVKQLTIILGLILSISATTCATITLNAKAFHYKTLAVELNNDIAAKTTALKAAKANAHTSSASANLSAMQQRRERWSNLITLLAPLLLNRQIESLTINKTSGELIGWAYSFKELDHLMRKLTSVHLTESYYLDHKVHFKLSWKAL